MLLSWTSMVHYLSSFDYQSQIQMEFKNVNILHIIIINIMHTHLIHFKSNKIALGHLNSKIIVPA